MSIEKCSISAADIPDEELTSFFVKLDLALQLEERQPLPSVIVLTLQAVKKKFIKYNKNITSRGLKLRNKIQEGSFEDFGISSSLNI